MCWPAGWQTSAGSCWQPQTGPAWLPRLCSTSQSQKRPWMLAKQPPGHHDRIPGHPAGQVLLPARQLTRRLAAVAASAASSAVSGPGRGQSLRPRLQLYSLLLVLRALSLQQACPCPSLFQQLPGQWGSHLHQHTGTQCSGWSLQLSTCLPACSHHNKQACSQPLQGSPSPKP